MAQSGEKIKRSIQMKGYIIDKSLRTFSLMFHLISLSLSRYALSVWLLQLVISLLLGLCAHPAGKPRLIVVGV